MQRLILLCGLFALILLVILASSKTSYSGKSKKNLTNRNSGLFKSVGVDRPFWAPNRIGTYLGNDGQFVSHIPTGSAGMEWPVGSQNTINFASGIWLAGKKNGEVVTAAAEFVSEFQPGNVSGHAPGIAGTPANPEDNRFKVYIINQGDELEPFQNPDYINWPAQDGAPVDADGKPLLLGTSTAWAVFNDFSDSLHNRFFQSPPMGVEGQMTAWGFDRRDVFGDMMFFRFKFINKSGTDITDSYVAFWADIDLGDARDLVGCDTTLALGYNYKNQPDGLYGDNPPAIGYRFLQGPVVPSSGDTANVSGRKVFNFRNLGMTSFSKYIGGGPREFSDPNVASEAYNYLAGLNLLGDPIIDRLTGMETKFWHTGDPVTGTGWLDPAHSDKRFLMSSGPFNLAEGDTQEVVMAIIIAQGESGLQSVRLLKQNSVIAQRAYDANFVSPPVPETPVVTAYSDTASILLEWDKTTEDYSVIDFVSADSLGNPTVYKFQGYNIYQLDSPALTDETKIKKIASFDVIDGVVEIHDDVFVPEIGQIVNMIVQDAQDTGLQRYLRITMDAMTTEPFALNQKYYFAVTAYGYNPFGIPRTLEGPIQPIAVRPQSAPLGTDLSTAAVLGDTLASTHVAGTSDGGIAPIVIERTALTGHTYEVRFRELTAGPDSGSLVYDVVDLTIDSVKAMGFTNQSDAEGVADYPLVDGVLVKVLSAPVDFTDFQMVANGAGPIVPFSGAAADFQNFPVPFRPGEEQQVGSGVWLFNAGGGSGSYDSFLSRSLRGSNFSRVVPFDWEMRFTARGSWAVRAFVDGAVLKIPFEIWNIGSNTPDDFSDDYRLIPWFLSNGSVGRLQTDPDGMTYQLDPNDHGTSGGTNDPYTPWVYWRIPADNSAGEAGYNAFVSAIDTTLAGQPGVDASGSYDFGSPEAFARTILVSWNGDDVADGEVAAGTQMRPEEGSIIRLITTKPNSPADVFSFESVAPTTGDITLGQKQAAQLVNVFPNPYHRDIVNLNNPFEQMVTFTHLPESETTIRIYTISGDLVRKLDHTNGTQFEVWDLQNTRGREVASGLYIIYIDMRKFGVKVLKLAVF